MDLEDAGMSVKFVLHDRDASFTAAFDAVFQAAGVRVVRSAIQAPRMNSIMGRWISSCRRELLVRTLIWNQRHLMTVLREYEDFSNTHKRRQVAHGLISDTRGLRNEPENASSDLVCEFWQAQVTLARSAQRMSVSAPGNAITR